MPRNDENIEGDIKTEENVEERRYEDEEGNCSAKFAPALLDPYIGLLFISLTKSFWYKI
jgi:hypothetical protein